MRHAIRQLATRLLGAVGVGIARRTPPEKVRELMRRLHPRATGCGLVRLGPGGDGGYLVPDDLAGIAACFSPGVSTIAGFEMDCAARGMDVYLADASVDGPPTDEAWFHFLKKYIGVARDERFMTMRQWVASTRVPGDAELIVQMDIEGHEYAAVLDMPRELLDRCRVIVVECHGLAELWCGSFFAVASAAFDKLLTSHACVHIHPNNIQPPIVAAGLAIPPVMEFTFYRRDRLGEADFARQFPHPLDADTTCGPSVALPACWWGGDE